MTLRGVEIFTKPTPLPLTPWAMLDVADMAVSVVMHAAWLKARMLEVLAPQDLRH